MSNLPRIERVSLESLVQDDDNPRFRTDRAKGAIAQSLRTYGPARSAVCDQDGGLVAGNGTVEAAIAIGMRDAIVVDAPDDALVVVRKTFTKAQARAYSIADNQIGDLSCFTDQELLEGFQEIVDDGELSLLETGFTTEELDELLGAEAKAAEEEGEDDDCPVDELFRDWPSDNEWGVPTLDLSLQATTEDLQGLIRKWGSRWRGDKSPHLIHFYTDDYRFWGLHKNPGAVVETGCKAAVEPNYTTLPGMARAEVLWWTYSKRVIARWWQSKGLRIFVDLNVHSQVLDLAMLGVPLGWTAYSTRWHKDNTEDMLIAEANIAARQAGSEILFVVFGGGQKVTRMCGAHRWIHVPEDVTVSRGRNQGG